MCFQFKHCVCACALFWALVALLTGAWMAELSRFRENLPDSRWVNWVGEFACGSRVTIERPSSQPELLEAVRRHKSVRAAATGHSFNSFACPAAERGAVIDMRAFRQVEVKVVGDSYTVVAEAGITMGQLQNEILARGLTLRVPPGNSAYTLGGCLATGCHNLGQSHAQDLLAVTIVLHNGTIAEVRRGEADFYAVAVSLGRLGIIISASLEVLPYRSLQWSAEQFPMPPTPDIIDRLEVMTSSQASRETVGNKLVFYLATGVMMMEHWVPTGRASVASVQKDDANPLPAYANSQMFRLGQGQLSQAYGTVRSVAFGIVPKWLLNLMQIPAEAAFRGLHTSPLLTSARKILGWQHSPEARGESNTRPSGNQYTWAGWIDEVMNLIMGLRHVEVIFPLEPKDRAVKCLDAIFAHRHLTWWRLNVRTQQSEPFYLSSTHAAEDKKSAAFLRVDFVGPGPLLDQPSGEASLTRRLHEECPGWRKHWGKGLFASSADERWGEPEAFLDVARRWDPEGKFVPLNSPSWLL